MDNKHNAQQRADQIQAFNAELNCLKDDNALELDDDEREKLNNPVTFYKYFRNAVKNNPDDIDLNKRLARNEKSLKELKNTESRLIAIDAGLDLQTLKQKYTDSSKYLMLRGEVRRYWRNKQLSAGIKQLFINKVHVPLPYSKEIGELTMLGNDRDFEKPRYQVGLEVGKRLEPWVVGVKEL